LREFLELFWAFIVIGATTFGGGYAILPALERELIKKRGWITMDEALDFFTIAQITPGIVKPVGSGAPFVLLAAGKIPRDFGKRSRRGKRRPVRPCPERL